MEPLAATIALHGTAVESGAPPLAAALPWHSLQCASNHVHWLVLLPHRHCPVHPPGRKTAGTDFQFCLWQVTKRSSARRAWCASRRSTPAPVCSSCALGAPALPGNAITSATNDRDASAPNLVISQASLSTTKRPSSKSAHSLFFIYIHKQSKQEQRGCVQCFRCVKYNTQSRHTVATIERLHSTPYL